MDKIENDAYVAMALKGVYERTSEGISIDAMVNRALTDKITSETINQKVNSQMNAITVGIKNINPKFNENSKNYDITKAAILDTLTNYEAALVELSEFYDGKIEQLILRKVELESHLLGSIVKDEYLIKKEEEKKIQKDNDKVKRNISTAFKNMIEKLGNKKKQNEIDATLISKAKDAQDIEFEIDEQLSARIEKTKEEETQNKDRIAKVEKEIFLINDEIKRINERKKQNLLDAMEVGEKWVTTTIKKPKTFSRITRFFVSKFNTPKIIIKTIIEPLNGRIEDFGNNELSNVKG
ncbi:MAG: hypothetical protein OSJ66_04265 [Clostridia bacterium]|nr:hypothetical protein [Clostridia bacterium]